MRPYLDASLPPVEWYADLFCFRHPTQCWLLDSRPRDALNTHDVRRQRGYPALAYETINDRPQTPRAQKQTTRWYVSAYLHADRPDVLPIAESILDGFQFGGKRNYGYGLTQLVDMNVVDLDTLDYRRLTDAEECRLELITPFVFNSEYSGAGETPVPWW